MRTELAQRENRLSAIPLPAQLFHLGAGDAESHLKNRMIRICEVADHFGTKGTVHLVTEEIVWLLRAMTPKRFSPRSLSDLP